MKQVASLLIPLLLLARPAAAQTCAAQPDLEFDGGRSYGTEARFSIDGRVFAFMVRRSGKTDDPAQLRTWDLASGRELLSVPGIHSFSLSPDGTAVITSVRNPQFSSTLWDVVQAARIRDLGGWATFKGPRFILSNEGVLGYPGLAPLLKLDGAVDFSKDGRIAVVVRAQAAAVLEIEGGRERGTLSHAGVKGARISPSGSLIATRGANGSTKMWDGKTLRELGSYPQYGGWPDEYFNQGFVADDHFVLSYPQSKESEAKPVVIGARSRPGQLVPLPGTEGGKAYPLAGGRVLVSRSPKNIKESTVWHAESAAKLWTQPATVETTGADGRVFATQDDNNRITVWRADSFAAICTLEGGAGVATARLSPDGSRIAVSRRPVLSSGTISIGAPKKVSVYSVPLPDTLVSDAARQQMEKEIATARAVSAKLSAKDKAQAQALFKQAFELFQAGEFEAAALQFNKGLATDPANGIAHFYLAETYERQQKSARARTHYQRTIDFAPGSKEAAIAETRIGK